MRYLPGMITDEEMLGSWLASLRPEDHEYLISIRDNGEHIGECSLTVQKMEGTEASGEIGYMLLPKFWNQGYRTETARLLMKIAESAGIKRITAATNVKNEASVRILQKLGFEKYAIGWMLTDVSDDIQENPMESYVYEQKA